MGPIDLDRIEAERRRLVESYLVAEGQRLRPSVRGIHHVALLSSDVEQTVRFYQGVLEFPLIEIFENRDPSLPRAWSERPSRRWARAA